MSSPESPIRVGALVPVRLTSERLPGKALMEIAGRPVLYHLLDRIAASRFIESPQDIVVCTTEDSADAPLVAAVEAYGASCFRGHKDDLIRRFHDAMSHFDLDLVMQADGDDPLTATEYLDLTMEMLLSDRSLGIVWSEGLPLGVNSKSFSRQAIERVVERYQEGQNDTGFIYFLTRTDIVKKAVVQPKSVDHVLDSARLTLDYREDFEVFRVVLEALGQPGEPAGIDEVISFLKTHPEVLALNAGLDEAYWARTREKADLSYRDDSGQVHKVSV